MNAQICDRHGIPHLTTARDGNEASAEVEPGREENKSGEERGFAM